MLPHKPALPVDSDGDGLVDTKDQCPHQAEDIDHFQDDDGCPDPDNDNDGIADANDKCPMKAEDVDGFQDKDGCPDLDNDNDHVADTEDKCPNTAGLAEKEGCPDNDPDRDGIPSADDLCPEQPEDKDGYQDDDGCPDLDNDKDGILDADDKCPMKAEVINGVDDEDGCPDKGKSKVKVTREKIEILDRVYFDTARATIQKRSYDVLNQVAATLKAHPEVTKLRVEGHTDSRGGAAMNQKLSQERADAVVDYMVDRGIDRDRLVAKGFGESQPIADNGTAKGRAKNRRVEFMIIDTAKTEVQPAK